MYCKKIRTTFSYLVQSRLRKINYFVQLYSMANITPHVSLFNYCVTAVLSKGHDLWVYKPNTDDLPQMTLVFRAYAFSLSGNILRLMAYSQGQYVKLSFLTVVNANYEL